MANCATVIAMTTVQTTLVPRAAAQIREVLWMLRMKKRWKISSTTSLTGGLGPLQSLGDPRIGALKEHAHGHDRDVSGSSDNGGLQDPAFIRQSGRGLVSVPACREAQG